MRSLVIGVLVLAGGQAAAADRDVGTACLSSGDTLEIVTAREVVPPRDAIRAARRIVPNADVLRAALCRSTEVLVYVVMLLQRDGRVVRVVVDAHAGTAKKID